MKKKLLAIICLTIALTMTGCGQSSSNSASEKEIAELKSEIEELKEENNELKAKIYDYENNKPAQTTEASELDGFVAETSGVCGADLTWEYGNGILRISGTGEMSDFRTEEAPWYDMRYKIVHVYVEEGCTSMGNEVFYGLESLSKIVLPANVEKIDYAFSNGYVAAATSEIDISDMSEEEIEKADKENRKNILSHLFSSNYTSLKVIIVGNKEYTPEEFVDYYFE